MSAGLMCLWLVCEVTGVTGVGRLALDDWALSMNHRFTSSRISPGRHGLTAKAKVKKEKGLLKVFLESKQVRQLAEENQGGVALPKGKAQRTVKSGTVVYLIHSAVELMQLH